MSHKLSSLIIASLAASSPAFAENADQTHILVTGDSGTSSTATRTDTPIRLIPQIIDQVSVDIARDYGLTTLTEALTGVPNVSDSGDTRFDGITIRGFSASADLYLDGMRDDAQYVRDLRNVERIEVLKGPAAVLYGRGSMGGIVNRISKKPQFADAMRLQGQVGSFETANILADVNTTLSDSLALRINAGYSHNDSYRNEVSGRSWIFAPSVRFKPAEGTDLLLQYEASHNQRLPDRGIPGLNGRPAPVDISTFYGDPNQDVINDRVQSLRARFSQQINDNWQIRYAGAYIALDNDFTNTFLTRANPATLQVSRARYNQILDAHIQTHFVETEGRFTTGALKHHILVGVEGSWQVREPYLTTASGSVPTLSLVDPDLSDQYRGGLKLFSDNKHRAKNFGLYIQDQISIVGGLELLVGVRADRFQIHTRRISSSMERSEETRVTKTLSPRAGLVYTPTWASNHSAYLSWSKGFQPVGGGTVGIRPASDEAAAANNALDPEKTRLWEIGLKSDWTSQLSTTLSIYDLDLYNRRTSDPERPGYVILLGRQRSRGVEASVNGKIAGDLGLRGGIGYQDARILRDTPSARSLAGKRPANIADFNGSIFAYYRPEKGFMAELGLVFSGDRYADNSNTVTLPGYERVDAMIGYRFSNIDLRLAVTNLTDITWYRTATSAGQIMPGTPRSITASLAFNF